MFEAFRQFLLRKASIKPQYIPFYLKWVSDCYAYLDTPSDSRLSSEQKTQFLSHMAKNHEDWQVKQADAAFKLYDYFLSRELKRSSSGLPGAWKDLEQRMGEALRLRQRSLSTEKTYLIGVRSPLDG